jgi:hypothetical protein
MRNWGFLQDFIFSVIASLLALIMALGMSGDRNYKEVTEGMTPEQESQHFLIMWFVASIIGYFILQLIKIKLNQQ